MSQLKTSTRIIWNKAKEKKYKKKKRIMCKLFNFKQHTTMRFQPIAFLKLRPLELAHNLVQFFSWYSICYSTCSKTKKKVCQSLLCHILIRSILQSASMGWRTGTQHLKGKALLPRLMIMKKINVKSGSYVEMLWNNFLFCFACSIIFPVH